MREPTLEQKNVLDSDARVRVVKASPGSGKTWLVAEVIRRELTGWCSKSSGIAALSFTRVGGEEIHKAVGYDLSHPHFVGTLDAFVLRYVIIPFLTKVCPTIRKPRLIPAEWNPGHWVRAPNGASLECRGTGGADARVYNILNVCFVDERNGKPIVKYRHPQGGGVSEIAAEDHKTLWEAKKASWRSCGWITHSDASLLASIVLRDPRHGASVRAEMGRRFPLVIVDELQDTGLYLGKCVLALLESTTVRGVLVGDPDQAIFEFNGARPDLFKRFLAIDGARSLPLARSRRCPSCAASVAAHLKHSGGSFDPAEDRNGGAFLVSYETLTLDVPKVVETVVNLRPAASIKVIARNNSTVEELVGRGGGAAPRLGCRPLNHILRAVQLFRQGRQQAALASARAAIDLAVLQYEGASDVDLAEASVDHVAWKQLAVRSILLCNAVEDAGTIHDWQTQAGMILDREIAAFGLDPALHFEVGKLRPKQLDGWNRQIQRCLPKQSTVPESVCGAPVQTVHGVKGETHDVTILVCPPAPKNATQCPSAVWWSEDAGDQEEKRIAYVAVTRTRGDLLVCVSEPTMERLRNLRPEFVASFECYTAKDFERAYLTRETRTADS